MFYFTDNELDGLIMEHLGHFDVTTSLLRLENKPAKIQFSTLESTVVCCTEEAMKIFTKFGIQTTLFTPSGEMIEKDIKFFEGEGLLRNIQVVLPAVENLIGFASGIATRTRLLIEEANVINPDILVASSNYSIPNTKKITNKAVKSAGGAIHINELSDTILINENYFDFIGKVDKLKEKLHRNINPLTRTKIIAEVNNTEDALKIADSGIDILQLNHLSVKEISAIKKEINKHQSEIKLAVKNFITPDNIKEYASSGSDIIVSTWIVNGMPAKCKTSVTPIFDMY